MYHFQFTIANNMSPTKNFCPRPVNQITPSGRVLGGWVWLTSNACSDWSTIKYVSQQYSARWRKMSPTFFLVSAIVAQYFMMSATNVGGIRKKCELAVRGANSKSCSSRLTLTT